MEKTHKHTRCSNGRNTGATGAQQEGFLEEVTSKLWKKSGVVCFFYQKVTLAANEELAGVLTEGRPARKLSQCCSNKWGAAYSPN